MRLRVVWLIFWVIAWPAVAFAKPKVAVAPLENDTGGKVAALVHDAAAAHAKVTTAKTVAKALKDLGITDPDNKTAAKKLRKHLEVDAVIYGKLEKDGAKTKLRLSVYTRGKPPDRFELEYKASSSKAFHAQLRDELASRLAPDETNQEDADEQRPAVVDDKDAKPERTAAADDSADGSTSVSARGEVAADDGARDGVTQAAVFADFGLGGVHRTLTYTPNTGGTTPPRVGTGAFAINLDAEIYPASFDTLDGVASALGVFGWYNRGVGLSIAIPGATQSAPISETSYAIGVRYRFAFGRSSLAAGLSYWAQSFVADRSMLTSPTQLNMPDTGYEAIAPGALLRLAVSPAVAVTAQVDIPLMLSSGPITEPANFGIGSVISFAVQAGADVAISRHYGLRFGGFFNQEGLSFKSGMVASATDRSIGGSVAFVVMY